MIWKLVRKIRLCHVNSAFTFIKPLDFLRSFIILNELFSLTKETTTNESKPTIIAFFIFSLRQFHLNLLDCVNLILKLAHKKKFHIYSLSNTKRMWKVHNFLHKTTRHRNEKTKKNKSIRCRPCSSFAIFNSHQTQKRIVKKNQSILIQNCTYIFIRNGWNIKSDRNAYSFHRQLKKKTLRKSSENGNDHSLFRIGQSSVAYNTSANIDSWLWTLKLKHKKNNTGGCAASSIFGEAKNYFWSKLNIRWKMANKKITEKLEHAS